MTWGGTDAEPARPTLPRDRFARLVLAGRDRLVAASPRRTTARGGSPASN